MLFFACICYICIVCLCIKDMICVFRIHVSHFHLQCKLYWNINETLCVKTTATENHSKDSNHLPQDKFHLLAEMCCWCDEMWYCNVEANVVILQSMALYIDRQRYSLLSIKIFFLLIRFIFFRCCICACVCVCVYDWDKKNRKIDFFLWN